MKTQLGFASITAVDAPTNPTSSTLEACAPLDKFYSKLQDALASLPAKDMAIILRDFIAQVGSEYKVWKSIIGPQGFGQSNENGLQLLDFCSRNNLFVTNIRFQHKCTHQATWYCNSDLSRQGHMIYFVLVSSHFRSTVLNTHVYCSTYHESDHELVVSSMRFKIRSKCTQARITRRQTSDFHPDMRFAFFSVLAYAFHAQSQRVDLETSWQSFRSVIHSARELLPTLLSHQETDWMTSELHNLAVKKKNAWLNLSAQV